MKASEIREMTSAEIQERIDTEKGSYQKLKMNHVVSSLENPLKLKYARKTIARLATELSKRAGEEAAGTVTAEPKAKAKKKDESVEASTNEDVTDEDEVIESEETTESEEKEEKAQA